MNIRLKTFLWILSQSEPTHQNASQGMRIDHLSTLLCVLYLCTNDMIVSCTHRCVPLSLYVTPVWSFFLSGGGGMIFTTTVTTNFAGSFSSKQASSFRTLRPVFQELLMMQDHTNILLSEATNHILNSKNSVEMLYDKPGPPYDSAKVDKNSKPGTYVYSKKKRELIF